MTFGASVVAEFVDVVEPWFVVRSNADVHRDVVERHIAHSGFVHLNRSLLPQFHHVVHLGVIIGSSLNQ